MRVLYDFYASWCVPCKMMKPVIEELKQEYPDRVKVINIEDKEHENLVKRMQIVGLPAFIVVEDDEIVSRHAGACTKIKLIEMLEKE